MFKQTKNIYVITGAAGSGADAVAAELAHAFYCTAVLAKNVRIADPDVSNIYFAEPHELRYLVGNWSLKRPCKVVSIHARKDLVALDLSHKGWKRDEIDAKFEADKEHFATQFMASDAAFKNDGSLRELVGQIMNYILYTETQS